MKLLKLFILSAFIPVLSYSQIEIKGKVQDVTTKSPLAFCSVVIKGTQKGSITNEDGVFKILVNKDKDSLVFSYLGYQTKIIPAVNLLKDSLVFLKAKENNLKEVVIKGDDEYLYQAIDKCRKKLEKEVLHTAKVYFDLETEVQNQPVEMLECYYNGNIQGATIKKLMLKNGRVGLAPTYDGGFFVSLNTSKAIQMLDLTESASYLPFTPFQFSKSKLKKNYVLKPLPTLANENVYHIEFSPIKNKSKYFKGEVWIDSETFSILKINLICENTSTHPFLPFITGVDSLANVSMNITQTYIKTESGSLLSNVKFNYRLKYIYTPKKSSGINKFRISTGNEVNTTGIMYMYDYEKPFSLPYFKYDASQTDYRKISFFPYNDFFWKNSDGLLHTESQKKKLEFFEKNGTLLNFDGLVPNVSGDGYEVLHRNFYADNNIFWSDSTRLHLKKDIQPKDSLKKTEYERTEPFFLKAQIFMDVNPVGDSIQHFSATVFDVFETYYDMPERPYTNCFINIWFDICEIERRKMEKKLNSGNIYTVSEIDAIYKQTIKDMNAQTSQYFKEVKLGKNTAELIKWNTYVVDNIGVDNIKIFGVGREGD